jgi:hypothetical protein
MAIKKFNSLSEAVNAGFTIDLGNGEYAEGGEQVPRERYSELFKPLSGTELFKAGSKGLGSADFNLPDYRATFLPHKPPK